MPWWLLAGVGVGAALSKKSPKPPAPPPITDEEKRLRLAQAAQIEQQTEYAKELQNFLPEYRSYVREQQRFQQEQQRTLRKLLPSDELIELQQQVATAQGKRTLAALKGELPVDPSISLAFDEEATQLEDTFRRQFGTGFKDSTPYTQASANLATRRGLAESASRRGDLESASRLFGSSFGQQTGLSTPQNFNPASFFAGDQALSGVLGQISSSRLGLLGAYGNDRSLQYQGQLAGFQAQQQARSSLFNAFGTGLGALFGGSFGDKLGNLVFG